MRALIPRIQIILTLMFILVMGIRDGRGGEGTRVLPLGQWPADQRKSQSRTIVSPFPFRPPASVHEWEVQSAAIRRRVLVSQGLWPMPARPAVKAVIHGTITKPGYTIEKVYFESLPGHFVCGNLYRPSDRQKKRAAVLFPHGHFGNGRLQETPADEAAKQIAIGAERFIENATYFAQSPLIQLTKMGCVVFQYDMVGKGDSQAIAHRQGYDDAAAVLWLQSFMGLQTWNSLRGLDFLAGLDDVDASRIGMTGASGGGTQTILIGAIDDRLRCSFPAVMVSTSMQGGCTCENAPLLRIGMGNVDIAAAFAPKPMGMTNANDWTLHFQTKGFPELQALYGMLGSPTNVAVEAFPQFKHNFNQVSREVMYRWMNQHLELNASSIRESKIDPVVPTDLSVFDASHRVSWASVEQLRATQSRLSQTLWEESVPQETQDVVPFQDSLRSALEVMISSSFPLPGELRHENLGKMVGKGWEMDRLLLSRVSPVTPAVKESVPTALIRPDEWDGKSLVVWVDSKGHAGLAKEGGGGWIAPVETLLKRGNAVLSPDVLWTGEHLRPAGPSSYSAVSMENPRFTLTYHRSLLAHRVHDIVTSVGYAKQVLRAESVYLAGFDASGPWVILASCLCRDHVRRTIADFHHFHFRDVDSLGDPMLLAGGCKYGDLIGLAHLLAPSEILVRHLDDQGGSGESLEKIYRLLGKQDAIVFARAKATIDEAIDWLSRP
ncbi:hypothetical protein K2X85_13320 [bacterium]|nr:hypothetical protein [bacterium]